ncbi:protein artichoke-like isoform X2 [Bacillus rossius redtenbacheri]
MKTAVALLLALRVLAQADELQCPASCSCHELDGLMVVDCWGRRLVSFPAGVHPLVQVLDVSNNAIRTIVDDVGHYPELLRLHISSNQIQAVPRTAFQNLPKLEYLDLSSNNISDLSQINADTFIENNTRLTELNLAGNPITNLGTDTKSVTSVLTSHSLEKLHLRDCKIDSVAGLAALKNLPKLTYLDLSRNPIKWIRNFGSPSLTYLDLSYCELDFLSPTALVKFPALRNLSLNGNNALSLTTGGLISSSLSHFEATYCSITRPRLAGLPSLVHVNFKGNKISVLREGEFKNNRYLKELDLSDNIISEIHADAFNGAEYLENLSLARNSISSELPPQIFSRNQYLKYLNVSKNDIPSLKNFDNPSLKYLDVGQCQIRSLDKNVLTKLPWLVSLSLSQNLLEAIPNYLSSTTLMDLDLSYCRISTIRNETFDRLQLLRSLDLTGNRLTEPIDVTILERLPHLSSIWLGDNPWHCNCESKKFKKLWDHITGGDRILKTDPKTVKCQTPERARGISWENSCFNEWFPEPASGQERFTRYGVIFLVCFFSVAAVLAIASTITKRIYRRKKRRRTGRPAPAAHPGPAQSRHSSESEEEAEVVVRLRESPEATARWVSQPPSYEEALLMTPAVEEASTARGADSTSSREDIPGTTAAHSDSASDGEDGDQATTAPVRPSKSSAGPALPEQE